MCYIYSMDIFSPIDGTRVGTVPQMTPREINQIIETAFLAQKNWGESKMSQRAKVLREVAAILEKEKREFIKLLVFEIAKPQKEAENEVRRTIEMIEIFIQEAEKITGETLEDKKRGKVAHICRVPLGTVLCISPFNYPINEAAVKILGALVTGNTVIFKPATQGAITSLRFAEIFYQAGLPRGVLVVATGKTGEIGDILVSHPQIAAINFTGSYQTALHLTQIAGVKKLVFGLSGKDAALVLEDCDLERAVSEITLGAFSFAGQRCTAIKRVLVEEAIADRFLENLTKLVKEKFILGDPRDPKITLGPVINDEAADYIQELVDDAKSKGAILVLGGKRKGRFWEATILDHVNREMRIAWEEPFGPVLPIIRVKDARQAIEIANKSEYGLQASIFTKDLERALLISKELEVATVQINGRPERAPDYFPFSGFKHSGLGMVAGAGYLISEMTRLKTTVFNVYS